MKKFRRKRVFLVLVLALLVVLFFNSEWISRWMYPIHYKDDIRISADNYKLEPQLLAAVIRTETNYEPGKESKKGAVGIMQIMPDTADWIVEKSGFDGVTRDSLKHRADLGIEMGAWYLNWLNKQFKGNQVAVIAAYNAGPGAVKRWMTEGKWDGELSTISDIPYGETRHYVQRVHYYYKKYKKLYPEF
ncbi:lytic transglycosylase domain-containing protein [Paenibacillus spongiae]|uniref:Lytic transglycosylase domain-containing protein n=1 Tax=Paenibacillus spongiae TaxID=2909671 RepID=A0ABY5S6M0_9BACL|nr:lytic transglycosylase domain-containing protein [Paenibacillus spongiae]UVI28480.1 lytic transglycosylase domain-containing protein [Paenibacillus spongiae]